MYEALIVFAAVLGLIATGSVVYTAWQVVQLRNKSKDTQRTFRIQLLRWSALDYIMTFLVLSGLVFLLADVIGVLRERDLYPYYHYGYLLSGFIFTTIGLLLLLMRLFLVLRLAGQGLPSPNQHHEPNQADHSE